MPHSKVAFVEDDYGVPRGGLLRAFEDVIRRAPVEILAPEWVPPVELDDGVLVCVFVLPGQSDFAPAHDRQTLRRVAGVGSLYDGERQARELVDGNGHIN